mmetsp:Transcript_39169/g.75066  ORF Transcript_39169/g.75066 Transcript_39169/m.75066 type:complete len:200 (-) Transcript_39169:373-972(-)
MPNAKSVLCRLPNAVPNARRAVVGGHPDDPSIVPQPALHFLREGYAGVAARHRARVAQHRHPPPLHLAWCGGEDELGLAGRRGVHGAADDPAHLETNARGQLPHPRARAFVKAPPCVVVPLHRQPAARGARLEAAPAVLRIHSQRALAVSLNNMDASVPHQVNCCLGISTVCHHIPCADDSMRRNSAAFGLVKNCLGGF